jgi:hypothetical protein
VPNRIPVAQPPSDGIAKRYLAEYIDIGLTASERAFVRPLS